MTTTTIELTRNENGTINIDATLDAAYTHLAALIEKEAEVGRDVSASVHAVFDEHLGKTIPMPALASLALSNMGTSPENFVEMDKAVRAYVRNAPEFEVNKGKNGGVVRVCDKPVKTNAKK